MRRFHRPSLCGRNNCFSGKGGRCRLRLRGCNCRGEGGLSCFYDRGCIRRDDLRTDRSRSRIAGRWNRSRWQVRDRHSQSTGLNQRHNQEAGQSDHYERRQYGNDDLALLVTTIGLIERPLIDRIRICCVGLSSQSHKSPALSNVDDSTTRLTRSSTPPGCYDPLE